MKPVPPRAGLQTRRAKVGNATLLEAFPDCLYRGPLMRALRFLLLYLAAVFLGAALLAPWLWKLAHAAAGIAPSLEGLARQPFHRYVNRCLLVLALVGLWPLNKAFGTQDPRDHGWNHPWSWPLAQGTLLGGAALASILLAALFRDAAAAHTHLALAPVVRRVFSSIATASIVAAIEEWLFRGIIHGALRRSLSFPATAAVTSLLYALVHFFDRPPAPTEVNAATGFWTLGEMLHGFLDTHLLVPGLVNLFIGGWTLALARERAGNLAFPIGIHAGWVLLIKSQSAFVTFAPDANTTFWGSHKIFDGYAASLALVLQLVVVHRLMRRPSPAAAA